jgi:ribosomal protein S18 acetylase RimI-like enzyme
MASQIESSVSLRPAVPFDANAASALIYETMPTLGEYLFGQPDAEGTIRVLAVLFREPGHLLSYQFSTLAEAAGKIVGIAQSLPSADLAKATARMVRVCGKCFGLRSALRLAWRGFPLAFEPDAEPGEWYVNTLAVASSRRNRGVGRALLENAERQARERSLPVCSLSVMLHNTGAKKFYEQVGYRAVRKHISRFRSPGVKYTGFYRMIKPVLEHATPAKGAESK